MKKIVQQLKDYLQWVDKRVLAASAVFIAVLVFCNYFFRWNASISSFGFYKEYISWFGLFFFAFAFPYIIAALFNKKDFFKHRNFLLLLLLAPAIFSWKMSFSTQFNLGSTEAANAYWNTVLYWPFKLMVLLILLFLVWTFINKEPNYYGLKAAQFSAKPYWLMLVIMLPLIAAASTQPDFLAMYPKLKQLQHFPAEQYKGFCKLLYELSYGSDFIGIELFFRGFLILGFVRWAGKDAILPMALFYCTIHFGKPLGECISSFFGGLILGVVTYHSKTIWGGLLVHLGIAWLMELGGYIGNLYK